MRSLFRDAERKCQIESGNQLADASSTFSSFDLYERRFRRSEQLSGRSRDESRSEQRRGRNEQ